VSRLGCLGPPQSSLRSHCGLAPTCARAKRTPPPADTASRAEQKGAVGGVLRGRGRRPPSPGSDQVKSKSTPHHRSGSESEVSVSAYTAGGFNRTESTSPAEIRINA